MARHQRTPRQAAEHIVRTLQQAGHVAYLAGGCVRDTLLGGRPKDYDVATAARPEQVMRLMPRSRFVGEAFGVVLARVDGHDVEIATFRLEGRYVDGRRPEEVAFTDAEHDAQRRDFTINGLFEDPFAQPDEAGASHGRIIDYVGGRADLQRGVVRAIGDADDRFAEDYLRMLRAVRFAARLGFEIEQRTQRAIRMHARYLGQISRERIGQEVLAMLSAPSRAAAAAMLDALNLDGPTLQEEHRHGPYHTLEHLPAEVPIAAALAAWLIDRQTEMGHADQRRHDQHDARTAFASALHTVTATRAARVARRWRKALSLSNEHYRGMLAVLDQLGRAVDWSRMGVAARKRLLACPDWHATAMVIEALAARPDMATWGCQVRDDVAALFAQGVSPEPWVSGQDLIELGGKPGPNFRAWLDAVYDAQLEGRVTDRSGAVRMLRDLMDGTTGGDGTTAGR